MTHYYTNIPSEIMHNKQLKCHHKVLFSQIISLTQKSGYCFASNKYFAELHGVDSRTIQRWLGHLKKLELIELDIKNNHIRKIYLKTQVQSAENVVSEGLECQGGYDTNSTHNSITNSKKNTLSTEPSKSEIAQLIKTVFYDSDEFANLIAEETIYWFRNNKEQQIPQLMVLEGWLCTTWKIRDKYQHYKAKQNRPLWNKTTNKSTPTTQEQAKSYQYDNNTIPAYKVLNILEENKNLFSMPTTPMPEHMRGRFGKKELICSQQH